MPAFLKNTIKNCKMKYKMILVVILAVTIVAGASMVALQIIVNRYNDLVYYTTAESLSLFVRDIEYNLKSVNDATSFMIADQSIQDNLEKFCNAQTDFERNSANTILYQSLHQHSTLNKYITAISLYLEAGNTFTINTNPMSYDAKFYNHVSVQARKAAGRPVWIKPDGNSDGIICTRAIRKIKYLNLDNLGVLIVHIDLAKIIHDSQQQVGEKNNPDIAIFSDKQAIYPENMEYLFDILPAHGPYSILTIDGEKQFVVQRQAGSLGWIYVSFTSYNSIFHSILFSKLMFSTALLLSITAAIGIAGGLTKNMLRHFDKLGLKMESFRQGKLTPIDVHYDYSGRQDELGMIHRDFDKMLADISDLIKDNYIKQLLLKDSKIKALKQQIDPHFLYNTLDAIHWRAKAAKQNEISQMVQALASLLRSSLSEQSDTVPLSQEIDFVENYMKIQKMRYAERLDFSSDIYSPLRNLPVPAMSVQPLIENAIHYVLEQTIECCIIRLRGFNNENVACIEVSNSGSQIDVNVLSKIETNQIKPRGIGIGLVNIDSRIKLIFGNEYGLSFRNTDDKAIVTMTLPLLADEKEK
jgi:two-component system sensor histidine kinase YesM